MTTLAFAVISAVLLVSAFQVIYTRNLVHAVFWLALALVGTAGLYITLEATFVAAIQVLLYAGGVITLMLFGIMLTARHDGVTVPNFSQGRGVGVVTAVAVLALLLVGIWNTDLGDIEPVGAGTSVEVGALFLSEHLLAFEALSVLLLAGMIGAIVLTRNTDP